MLNRKWYRMRIRTLTLPHYPVLRLLLLLLMQISFLTWMQMLTCLVMSIVILFFNQWSSKRSSHKWMVILFSFCFFLLFFFFSDEYFSGLHCNLRSLTAHFDIFLCIFLSRLWELLKSSLKLNNNFNQYWLTRNFFTSQPFYSNAGGVAFMLTRN